MIHQAGSGPSRKQLFHFSTAARVIPYRIVNASQPVTCLPDALITICGETDFEKGKTLYGLRPSRTSGN